MPREADFDAVVVTKDWVEVEFRTTRDRFKFRRIDDFLSLTKPHIDRHPNQSLYVRFPEWELNWLARQTAERVLEEYLLFGMHRSQR